VEGFCEQATSDSVGNEGILLLEKSLKILFQGSPYNFCEGLLTLTNQLLSFISLVCGETESTWYIDHYFAYRTSPG
jgi:hypothetical protein